MEANRIYPTVGLIEKVEEAYKKICCPGLLPNVRQEYEHARRECLDALCDRAVYLKYLGVLGERDQREYESIMKTIQRLII